MAEDKFIETALNPFLEDLVQYVAENFTLKSGDNTKWYRIIHQYSDVNEVHHSNDTFTHKEVVKNWVDEQAASIIDKFNEQKRLKGLAKNINELTPAYAFHPGVHLADELETRGLTTLDLQEKTRVIRSDWDGIIAGEIDINELYAAFLQMALGIDAKLWLALQRNYEEDKKKIAAKEETDISFQTPAMTKEQREENLKAFGEARKNRKK